MARRLDCSRFSSTSRKIVVLGATIAMAGGSLDCGGAVRRYPLKQAMWRDPDAHPFQAPCRPDPDEKDPKHVACTPEPYESPLAWDAADNTIFRPLARVWAVDPGGEAKNVNAFDEVADSSWFEARIGRHPISGEELTRGPCAEQSLSDEGVADGAWLIDQGKPHGATPGFRVNVPGRGRFMFKVDEAFIAERSNTASVIGSRLYHAVGFHTPCETTVDLRPEVLRLKPGLTFSDNSGVVRPFDKARLEKILQKAERRNGKIHLEASQWLSGVTLGPFRYEGVRDDDPNDVIPHEDRRELRGARLLAAWLNHFDAREQNTMVTWVALPGRPKDSSPGYLKHFYLDFSDSLGSEWDWDAISRRLGHSYYLDFGHVSADFITLGVIERPWDRAHRRPPFGYFSERDFDPEAWRPGYPNPAFSRMTERDGAWMARLLARFSRADVHALVQVANLKRASDAEYLERVLVERHRRILQRYLGRLSPLSDLEVRGADLCATDLGRLSGVWPAEKFQYHARQSRRGKHSKTVLIPSSTEQRICLSLTHDPTLQGLSPNASERYVVVSIWNGVAPGRLDAHLYDLGPERGFQLVGLERQTD